HHAAQRDQVDAVARAHQQVEEADRAGGVAAEDIGDPPALLADAGIHALEPGQLPGARLVEPLVAGPAVVVAHRAEPVVVDGDAEEAGAQPELEALDADAPLDRIALGAGCGRAVPQAVHRGVGYIAIGHAGAVEALAGSAGDVDAQGV